MVHFNYEDLRTMKYLITAEMDNIHNQRRSLGFFNKEELDQLEHLNIKVKRAITESLQTGIKDGE